MQKNVSSMLTPINMGGGMFVKFYVYQLRASDENYPFYIGKSFENSKRLIEHHHEARKTNRMKSIKMRSVIKRGAEVLEEILYWFDVEDEAHKKERELIALYGRKDLGTGILCNHTSGGEGIIGQIISEETRRKMSEAKRGNKINVGRKRPDFADLWKKPITVFDIDGNIIHHCESSKEAAEITGGAQGIH